MKYNNPIIPGFYPDPSICRVGEDYYLATSTLHYFPGVSLFHSKDLINWRQIGHCLTRETQAVLHHEPSSRGVYAPTLRYYNGRFYVTMTNALHGGAFYVHTDDPAGEWSEPVWVKQQGGDPSFLFDDDGTVYYITSGNLQSIIDIETGNLLSEPKIIWEGSGGGEMEAPHLYHIGDWYYLMTAEGGTSIGHMISIARSKSPWGPFEACLHNPILTHSHFVQKPIQATGHADLVQAHDGSWWLVFLGIRQIRESKFPRVHQLGRETFLAPVTWEDGWPVVNNNQPIECKMEAACLPQHPWPAEPTRDDFDASTLRLCYSFIRNPYPETWSLTDRPGWLRLNGSAVTLHNVDSPAFIGRRQQHHNATAKCLLEFTPDSDNDEAGMTLYMDENHHYELAVTRENGTRSIIVRCTVGHLSSVVARQVLPAGAVTLEITCEPLSYGFCYISTDTDKVTLASCPSRYLSSEIAGGFTGPYIGLYATGNGKPCSVPADFDWLDYIAKE